MKKFALLTFFAAFMSACTLKYYEAVFVVDYTKYVEEGFAIYPVGTELKEKNYIPLSHIEIKFYDGEEGEWTKKNLPKDAYTLNYQNFVSLKGDYIISRIVEEAKKFNANGIIDFTIIEKTDHKIASCMAVKIQQ